MARFQCETDTQTDLLTVLFRRRNLKQTHSFDKRGGTVARDTICAKGGVVSF